MIRTALFSLLCWSALVTACGSGDDCATHGCPAPSAKTVQACTSAGSTASLESFGTQTCAIDSANPGSPASVACPQAVADYCSSTANGGGSGGGTGGGSAGRGGGSPRSCVFNSDCPGAGTVCDNGVCGNRVGNGPGYTLTVDGAEQREGDTTTAAAVFDITLANATHAQALSCSTFALIISAGLQTNTVSSTTCATQTLAQGGMYSRRIVFALNDPAKLGTLEYGSGGTDRVLKIALDILACVDCGQTQCADLMNDAQNCGACHASIGKRRELLERPRLLRRRHARHFLPGHLRRVGALLLVHRVSDLERALRLLRPVRHGVRQQPALPDIAGQSASAGICGGVTTETSTRSGTTGNQVCANSGLVCVAANATGGTATFQSGSCSVDIRQSCDETPSAEATDSEPACQKNVPFKMLSCNCAGAHWF